MHWNSFLSRLILKNSLYLRKMKIPINTIYSEVKLLIGQLKKSSVLELADILSYRMFEVSWTTGHELYEK